MSRAANRGDNRQVTLFEDTFKLCLEDPVMSSFTVCLEIKGYVYDIFIELKWHLARATTAPYSQQPNPRQQEHASFGSS